MSGNRAKSIASMRKRIYKSRQLYLLVALPVLYLLIFCYYPMLGAQIAFKDFNIVKGIWASPWVGLKHFEAFFSSYQFSRIIINTIVLSLYSLIVSFPIPIILALCINYTRSSVARRTVQMITYAPYFISTVVLVGIMNQLFATRTGVINNFIELIGFGRIDILNNPDNFRALYVWSGTWQGMGFGAIIFIAALTSIDPGLYEAARIDGANRFQQIWYIDIPSLLPTVIIMLILNCGSILSVGFERVFLMQTPRNLAQSEVIATFVFKSGIKAAIPMYSYSTAVGLFTSVVNLILLMSVNWISKKVNETSLW